jgi:hypothetical protein
MAYDPSILSKIGQMGPNPVGAMQDAYTLKNVIDTSQINQMKLNEERQAVSDQNTLRSLAGKYDMSTGEGQAKFFAEASKVNPSMAMKLQREFSEAQSGQLGLKKAELELYAAKNDIIGNALLPIAQRGEELKAQGKSPQEINALMLPLVTQAVGTLKQQTLPNGKPVLEPQDLQQAQQLLGGGDLLSGVTGLVVKSKQSGERLHQLMQEHLAVRREETAEARLAETERHGRRMEELASRRISGDSQGGMSPEDYKFIAAQYLAGDKGALQNIGRGVQGARDLREIRKEIRALAEERGMSAADVAAKMAEFEGFKAGERALGTSSAKIEQASSEANKMIDVARKASDAVPRGSFLPWSKIVQKGEVITNDPALAKLGASALAVVNTWARSINPSGVPTQTDKEHAYTLLDTAKDQAAFNAILEQFQVEIQASLNAPAEVKQALHDRFVGKPSEKPSPAPSPTPSVPPARPPSGGAGAGPSKKWKMVDGKLVEDK